ncbi:RNA-directed DNA polymerase, eukaryota [Tanacetum coccineum]
MADIISRWHDEVVVMGDFNEPHYASERHGSIFHASNVAEFNMFIVNSHLNQIPLGGYSFTWTDKYANKMSRFCLKKLMLITVLLLFDYFILGYWRTISYMFLKTLGIMLDQERKRFHESLIEIDLRLDQGVGLPDDLLNQAKIVRDLQAINKKDSINLAQKSKVKWAIKGDENTKFFHGVTQVPLEDQFLRRLNIELSRDLERDVNSDEIKKAVWDCGSYKSPVKDFFSSSTFANGCNLSFIGLIPKVLDAKHLNDFRPISLVGCQYKIIGKILANRLSLVIDDIISHELLAFVKGRKIMDGPIILNERLIDRGMFTPVTVGNDNTVPISHLFCADDAMFIGKWTCENVNVLMLILHHFFLVSGLKINVQKSSIFGVGVRPSVVRNMAARYGCIASTLPFTYLGIKVGANMKRISSWDVVINKVTSKLSTWKAKSLSVGGRLTFIISVLGAILSYYMSLFKAPEAF